MVCMDVPRSIAFFQSGVSVIKSNHPELMLHPLSLQPIVNSFIYQGQGPMDSRHALNAFVFLNFGLLLRGFSVREMSE